MSMKRKAESKQSELWIPADEVASSPGHPFYTELNKFLDVEGFDHYAEGRCEKFYKKGGRPGIPPGVYFRMLLIGYFEGLDSERGIAWRCADSLALRSFLGYDLRERTPDHSSLTIIRQRFDVETHQEVFQWVLRVLGDCGLLKGKIVGVDATTLEANAALRSIVRRDTEQSYDAFLTDLAKASGIDTPTRSDLAKVDRKRPNKGSNNDWKSPHDPDARITKMKDGRTHLAHKAEHAVDLETGAIMAVGLHHADKGDTKTLADTVDAAQRNLEQTPSAMDTTIKEVITDKGYHSNDTLTDFADRKIRTYFSEPDRGRRNWKGKQREKDCVYANRRRVQGERGKGLLRKRGELLERPFAHCYNTGGMRRTQLREHDNIMKRLLVHVAGCNLALLMRSRCGTGTPRGIQAAISAIHYASDAIMRFLEPFSTSRFDSISSIRFHRTGKFRISSLGGMCRFSTGC